MAMLQATVQGAAPANDLLQVSAYNTEKMDNKDRWMGRSEITGLNSTHIKAVDTSGITFKLLAKSKLQDTVVFSANDCRADKAGTSVSCKKKGVGSLRMKAFTDGTTTFNKDNKVRSLKDDTHDDKKNSSGIFQTDLVTFYKTQWKFMNRQFADDKLEAPLGVTIIPPAPLGEITESLSSDDCTTKELMSGGEKIDCKA
jgi:hypothetical protein